MKKQLFSFVACAATLLPVFKTTYTYSQSTLAKGFSYNEAGMIYEKQNQPSPESLISFVVYDNRNVRSGKFNYVANEIYGFTLKNSGKRFISATLGLLAKPQFVEDLTPEYNTLKVVKAFIPDEPLTQKDSVIMGIWVNYIVHVKPDGSRSLFNGYKKIAEVVKADCPGLSKKISDKEKGYFLAFLKGSLEEELEVFLRITKEFNACKD